MGVREDALRRLAPYAVAIAEEAVAGPGRGRERMRAAVAVVRGLLGLDEPLGREESEVVEMEINKAHRLIHESDGSLDDAALIEKAAFALPPAHAERLKTLFLKLKTEGGE